MSSLILIFFLFLLSVGILVSTVLPPRPDTSDENYDHQSIEATVSREVESAPKDNDNPHRLRKRSQRRLFNYLAASNLTEKFTYIYKTKLWSSEGRGCGPGSSMEQTVDIRERLPILVKKYEIYSLLDCPCGAMNWMPFVLKEIEDFRSNFTYTGIDIVPDIIKEVKREFLQHPNWDFRVGDMTSGGFQIKPYDLILSRDVFFHLRYDKIKCAVNAFSNSKSRFLMTTTMDVDGTNHDNFNFYQYRYRGINVEKEPLNFPPALESIYETKAKRFVRMYKLPLPLYTLNSENKPLVCD